MRICSLFFLLLPLISYAHPQHTQADTEIGIVHFVTEHLFIGAVTFAGGAVAVTLSIIAIRIVCNGSAYDRNHAAAKLVRKYNKRRPFSDEEAGEFNFFLRKGVIVLHPDVRNDVCESRARLSKSAVREVFA